MKVISLQSGSNGNCTYVEADGVRLLFDAGISGRQAQQRLAAHGRDITGVDALLVSHDHSDHSRCLGIYHRKFGLPVHVTELTLEAAESRHGLGAVSGVRFFNRGTQLRFGHVTVETIPTPHDGVDGVAFVVDDGRRRLGILTDLGHVFDGLDAILASLDGVILESNFDPEMLAQGSYPEHVQQRIRGPGGHLSNLESAEMLNRLVKHKLQWVCLAHLSGENNTPEHALGTHRKLLGKRFPLVVAGRYTATDVLEL